MTEASYRESVEQAARLLARARLPLISGLRTDIAGIVAAIRLAQRLRGAIDHVAAQSSLNEHRVLGDIGLMFVTPAAAHLHCDTLLLVGAPPSVAGLGDSVVSSAGRAPHSWKNLRRVVKFGCRESLSPASSYEQLSIVSETFGIAGFLAAVRAQLNGRPISSQIDTADVSRCVELLAAASYGVALWRSENLGSLELEMLAGLVKDLNRKRRWSGLSVSTDPTAIGATMALGCMSGFPLRTGFLHGHAQHDPWQFESRRLLESGEADVVIWVSAFGDAPPDWLGRVPTILVSSRPLSAEEAAVSFQVGSPGRDHDAVLHDSLTGTLVEAPAEAPSDLPTVADVLTHINEALPAS